MYIEGILVDHLHEEQRYHIHSNKMKSCFYDVTDHVNELNLIWGQAEIELNQPARIGSWSDI